MSETTGNLAQEMLNNGHNGLSARERKVLEHIVARKRISLNVNEAYSGQMSFGERLADRVASFGGSWTFIILFFFVLVAWVVSNTLLLGKDGAFDPYPFIFLNLMLSMIAAVQAPITMMSQNRQAAKDRLIAGHDYEINMKAELEILGLHEKLDDIRQQKLALLMKQQEEQMKLLAALITSSKRK